MLGSCNEFKTVPLSENFCVALLFWVLCLLMVVNSISLVEWFVSFSRYNSHLADLLKHKWLGPLRGFSSYGARSQICIPNKLPGHALGGGLPDTQSEKHFRHSLRAIDVLLLLVYSESYFKVSVWSFLHLCHAWILDYWLFIPDDVTFLFFSCILNFFNLMRVIVYKRRT